MRGQMSGTEVRLEIAAITGSLRAGSWARVQRRPGERGCADRGGRHAATNREMRCAADRDPEYNMSIPGVLKNALDWVSRPYGQSPLLGKPVTVVGTSPLPSGGASALSDVGKLASLIGAHIVESDLAIGSVHTRFGQDGRISDPELAVRIGELLAKVADAADPGSGSLKAS
jgi:hypothetical protein